MRTSMMKSQRKPSRPAAPLMWPTPKAGVMGQFMGLEVGGMVGFVPIAPPKAPARLQNAMTMAMRTARSLKRYQMVMKYTIPVYMVRC